MRINHVPAKSKKNQTGCCPEFDPAGWDGKTFTFKNKKFVRFTNRNLFYIPLNLGSAIVDAMRKVAESGAAEEVEHVMLSRDLSPWESEHFLAVTKEVVGMDNFKLTGTYLAKVFEGPYKDTPKWIKSITSYVRSKHKSLKTLYFNYTMCPVCAKFYGKNYVVGFAQVS